MMPRGIEKLSCLEILDSAIVRKEAEEDIYSGIEELAALNSLQILSISNLEIVRGGIEYVKRAKLQDKTNLSELYLYWSEDRDDEDDDMVLEGLLPHPNLKRLQICCFLGLNFPKWMSDRLLPNLVGLRLWYCRRCEKLPALGMLPCLRHLEIWNLDSVKCLVREFYYQQQEEEESIQTTTTSSILFPRLVELNICDMENLEEW
ncbi:hypothetical protein MKX01_004227, partial [Papaver californicum]